MLTCIVRGGVIAPSVNMSVYGPKNEHFTWKTLVPFSWNIYKEEKYYTSQTSHGELWKTSFSLSDHIIIIHTWILILFMVDLMMSHSLHPVRMSSYTLAVRGSKCSNGHFLLPSLSKNNLRFAFLPQVFTMNMCLTSFIVGYLPQYFYLWHTQVCTVTG